MTDWTWQAWDELSRTDIHDLFRLRNEVFVVEQDCVYQDIDGTDPVAFHLLGRREGNLVAYIRAFGPDVLGPEMVIGRVIVAASARGTGLGRVVMREAQHRLQERFGAGPIKIGAKSHLAGFYGSLGYEICGPEYDEDGIPHVPMRRAEGTGEDAG